MEITKEQLKTLFDKHGVNCDITCSRFSGYVDDSFDSVFEAVQELVKNCVLADVGGNEVALPTEPHTKEMLNVMLVNSLKKLNGGQRDQFCFELYSRSAHWSRIDEKIESLRKQRQ